MTSTKEIMAWLRQSFADWNAHNAPRLGAALAFYTILSISPLVIFAVAAVSLFFDRATAQAHLLAQVQAMVGQQGRDAVQSMLASGQKASSGVVATMVGLATLLFGASGVFGELRSALNTIWDTKPSTSSGVLVLLKERLFSIGMVFSVGFVLLVSLLVSAGLAILTTFFSELLPMPAFVLSAINFLISFVGIAFLFALILKYVPEAPIEWRDVRVGATVTAFFFTLGKTLLGWYFGKASPGSPYGAAGSLVVLVVWVYYSAQIFFFGAEFTHVHALARRKDAGEAAPAKG